MTQYEANALERPGRPARAAYGEPGENRFGQPSWDGRRPQHIEEPWRGTGASTDGRFATTGFSGTGFAGRAAGTPGRAEAVRARVQTAYGAPNHGLGVHGHTTYEGAYLTDAPTGFSGTPATGYGAYAPAGPEVGNRPPRWETGRFDAGQPLAFQRPGERFRAGQRWYGPY